MISTYLNTKIIVNKTKGGSMIACLVTTSNYLLLDGLSLKKFSQKFISEYLNNTGFAM